MTLLLRDYQVSACNDAETFSNQGEQAVVVAPTGAGKTVMLAENARRSLAAGRKVLIGCHREEILGQIASSINRHLGFPPQIISADRTDPMSDVTVAMIPTLTRRHKWIEALRGRDYLLDECFPAGTPVDGRPIESLRPGDMVCCFDEAAQAIVQRPVVRLFKNPAPSAMIRLRLEDGRSLTCTPGHPIYVRGEWLPAASVAEGDTVMLATTTCHVPDPLCDLRGRGRPALQGAKVSRPQAWLDVLLNNLQSQIQRLSQLNTGCGDQPQVCVSADAGAQSDEKAGSARQGICIATCYGLEADCAGRQRAASAARADAAGFDAGLGNGSVRENWLRARQRRLSSMLQAGHCINSAKDWRGDRRIQPLLAGATSARQEERFFLGKSRVASVEVLQEAGGGESGRVCADGFVYNIEVEQHHNYFANDILVHNCHHHVAPGYQRLKEKLQVARMIGYTATPITPTGDGLGRAGFTRMVLGPEPRWLMDNGFLCDYEMWGGKEVDVKDVPIIGGEYSADVMMEKVIPVNGVVVRDWQKYNPDGHRTIAVGVSVEHAEQLATLYQNAGISAVAVSGSTPRTQRKAIFDRFRSGEITVLCACAVVDEGLDVPEATCLQLVRAVRSLRLYRQLIGRVLRPSADKQNAIIIDHGGSWRTLPAPDARIDWSLDDRLRRPKKDLPSDREIEPSTGRIISAIRVQEARDDLFLIKQGTPQDIIRDKAQRGFRKAVRLYEKGILPTSAMRSQLRMSRYLDEQQLRQLQQICELDDKWLEQQLWLNSAFQSVPA